ncbi:helix-turn-helix domain-containing protein [Nocardia puris]|uniref:PucR-like helix-turn-helix protein n=1 Tax=Nocardia puris TaxID=208602 RepID=A0A366D7M8_9NOCA|nr:helix-turn-helix domain-containing protein [Nocardia puris]MBF6212211.1 helix-turn-helix domain-containing protein [Nocardia puris]MBF6370183.1 helix-turn-helix domain-containing protein [Nocardia puris]MBF6460800.1 helix-turn-helix domain-containing protein [Nocardia puris]RBO85464.1 PucR-like helix-turn-helix protein [Nocardia puris]
MGSAPDPSIVRLAESLLVRVEELGAAMAEVIRRDVDFYRSNPGIVTTEELRRSCVDNMTYVFEALSGATDPDVAIAIDTGTKRAVTGVPLTAVMAAYRVGFRFIWETTLAEARRRGDVDTESVLTAISQIMVAMDTFTQAMTGAYRQQLTSQILGREAERSALVEAILFGRITDTQNLWDAADALRLPTSGPYVVVAAEVPAIGRTGLPEIANRLDARDIRSAWRLLPDLQVGIVHLRRPACHDVLLEVLRAGASARVGLSPAFADLADTGEALRFARLAITGKARTPGEFVQVFDDSPLAVAAVSAPEVMHRIGQTVLGPLDALPEDDRDILIATFEAWLDAGGSAAETAARIHVHPNTVRHRLRRIEERTGRSLSRPRDVAELCLALEVHRRLPG